NPGRSSSRRVVDESGSRRRTEVGAWLAGRCLGQGDERCRRDPWRVVISPAALTQRGETMRRTAVTIAALTTLAAAACSSSSSTTSTTAAAAGGAGSATSSAALSGTVTVLAAASLTESFTTIGKMFEAAHPGVTVKFSFGASSTLAQQINNGAPADVFASAS